MAFTTGITSVARDRKKGLLAICLCLFAISLTYRLLNPYHQEKVARLTYQSGVSPASKAEPKAGSLVPEKHKSDVWVDLYRNPPEHSGKVHKNIFQKPKPPETVSTVPEESVAAGTQPPSPEIDKRLEVQEELSKFKSFGFVQGKGEKILFLERGKDILLLREGDRIETKYLVKSITEKQLIIRAENIGEDVRIDLGKF